MSGERPFELQQKELETHIEEMVTATISDLSSEFLLMPTGVGFVRYPDFQSAYEVLKRNTEGFQSLSLETIRGAPQENSLVLGVLRSILGMTAPEWAELARVELGSDITQGAARNIDKDCRTILLLSKADSQKLGHQDDKTDRFPDQGRHSVHRQRRPSGTGGCSPPFG